MTLNSAGVLSGTPTASGPFSFTAKVADSSTPTPLTATQPYSFTIGTALTITTTSLPNGVVNVVYPSTTLQAAGGNPPYTWTVSAGALPAGMTLNSAGVLSGTPSASGPFSFTAKVADSSTPTPLTATQPYSFTIGTALTITTTALPNGVVNVAYPSTPLQAAGGATPYAWSVSAGALPTGLTLSAAGVLSGTPTVSGPFSFTAKVTDSSAPTPLTATQVYNVTIRAALTITTTSLPNGTVGVAYSQALAASGGTPPYSNWTVSSGALPGGLKLNASSGVIGGTPTTTTGSPFAFSVTVKDSAGLTSVPAAFLLSIMSPSGTLSIITLSIPNGVVGVPYQTVLNAQGGTAPYTWSAAGVPFGLTLGANGTLAGTPGAAGPFTITVTVTDSQGNTASAPPYTGTINTPTLSASPNALTISYRQQDPAPAPQSISTFSSGAPVPFNVAVATDDGANWLTAGPNGQTPGTVTVSTQNLNSLAAPNVYTGHVTLKPASGSTTTIAVSLSLQPAPQQPAIGLEPGDLTVSLAKGGTPVQENLVVSNTGTGTLAFRTTVGCPWVALSGGASSLLAGQSTVIAATVSPGNMPQGTYFCNIGVQDQAAGLTASLTMTLQVNPQPSIVLSQTGLSFLTVQNGTDPPPQTLGVINIGGGPLSWSTVKGQGCDWLTPTASGSGVGGGVIGSLQISASGHGLSTGQYSCTVQVMAPGAANSPQLLTAQLTVLPAGQTLPPQVYPTGVILTAQAGGANPPPVTINITDQNGLPVTYTTTRTTSVTLSDGSDWFAQSPASGSIATSGGSLSIQGQISQLPAGLYQGTLGIGFSDGNAHTVQVLALVTGSDTSTTQSSGASKRSVAPRQSSGAICFPSSIPANTPQITVAFNEPETSSAVSSPGPVPLQVTATNACGAPVTDGPVYVYFSTDPKIQLEPSPTTPGLWEGSWAPVALGTEQMQANAQSQSTVNTLSANSDIQNVTVLAAASTAAPLAYGAESSASATPNLNVAVGSLVTIYGERLVASPVSALQIPLPPQLGDTQVQLSGKTLPLLYANPNQINLLIPLSLQESDTQLSLVVQTTNPAPGSGSTLNSTPIPLKVVDFQPAIFSQDASGTGPGSIQDQYYNLVTENNKVSVGEYIFIYCTGLGPVNNPPAVDGGPAPSSPLATTLQTPTVTFGDGANAITVTEYPALYFSGLTPGFAGLYQVDVQIPQGVQPGDVNVSLSIGGQTSNTVTVAVQ
jgi:uncharacterized protein (TIGR03437 family)